jgi:broad specificity phosphatase PhoE
MKNLFLVRHGQSVGNIDKSKYFTTLDCDIELTETGKEQCVNAGLRIIDLIGGFKDSDKLHVHHSPYKRAIETKEGILGVIKDKHASLETFETCNPLLRERHWGGLRDIVQMGQKTESHFNFFYRPPSDGESFADCYQRCVLFDMVLKSKDEDNVVIVSHGEWIKLYLMHLLSWTPQQFNTYKNPKNCEVYHFVNGDLSSNTPLTMKPNL